MASKYAHKTANKTELTQTFMILKHCSIGKLFHNQRWSVSQLVNFYLSLPTKSNWVPRLFHFESEVDLGDPSRRTHSKFIRGPLEF